MKRNYCYAGDNIVYYREGSIMHRKKIDKRLDREQEDLNNCFLCSNKSDKYLRRKNGLNMSLCSEHLNEEISDNDTAIDIDLYIRNKVWFDIYDK